jgi:hypothetical protein
MQGDYCETTPELSHCNLYRWNKWNTIMECLFQQKRLQNLCNGKIVIAYRKDEELMKRFGF